MKQGAAFNGDLLQVSPKAHLFIQMKYHVDGFVPFLLFASFMYFLYFLILFFFFKLSFSDAFTPPAEKMKGLISNSHGAAFSPGTA